MIIIGITGGIGAGKSEASKYIARKGYALIDADQIARDITKDGAPVLNKLNEVFGPRGKLGVPGTEIINTGLNSNGKLSLNRKALASVVFSDTNKRKSFDKLMHSSIIREIDGKIKEYKNGLQGDCKGVLVDAPLLFEAGIDDRCDTVLLLTADEDIRIKRVVNRDELTEEEVRSRIRNQMSDEKKAELSDYVIDNSGDCEALKKKLDRFLQSLG